MTIQRITYSYRIFTILRSYILNLNLQYNYTKYNNISRYKYDHNFLNIHYIFLLKVIGCFNNILLYKYVMINML